MPHDDKQIASHALGGAVHGPGAEAPYLIAEPVDLNGQFARPNRKELNHRIKVHWQPNDDADEGALARAFEMLFREIPQK